MTTNGLVGATAIAFQANAQARGASAPPDVALGLLASQKWPGFTPSKGIHGPQGQATAIAWIQYAKSNQTGKLRRPLVFVEGIDFDVIRGGKTVYPFAVVANHAI
ncbi:hypothetical protein ACFQ48_20860 [Hymenobacter caeli]|uniref:Uncharacterized protein n=1 Tax=Hymenobacter caeli TaxID=2735894 RepID=A0ABX2FW41_9BACT|nr:hypothetical protein [Hymenobacter caeli]NRT21443.1 hypothetical protein [Hymenobacter caeli]